MKKLFFSLSFLLLLLNAPARAVTISSQTFGTYIAGCAGYFETLSTWTAQVAISTSSNIVYERSNVDIWTAIEPTEDVFNWSTLDSEVGVSTNPSNGFIFTVPILNTIWGKPISNSLSAGSTHSPEAILVRYSRFLKALAQHYNGVITRWEIWNEPNLPGAWAGETNPSAAEYVQLLATAYYTLKSVNPNNFVIMGAVAGPEVDGVAGGHSMVWFDAFLKAGGANYLDAINMHNYGSNVQSAPTTSPVLAFLNMKSEMNKWNVSKPLWVTESGYTADNFWLSVSTTVNENAKADFLVKDFAYLVSQSNMGPIYWHALRDCSATEVAPFFDFGLYNHDLVSFPAATALAGFQDRLINYTPDGFVSQSGLNILQFHNGATIRWVAWSAQAQATTGLTIPGGFSSAGERDGFNTFLSSYTAAQWPAVSISTTAVYLEMVP